VLLFTVGILILLIVPGKFEHPLLYSRPYQYPEGNRPDYCFCHGWPWNYLDCYVNDDGLSSNDGIPWLDIRGWRFIGEAIEFSPIVFFLDIITAAAILFLIAAFFEWRRRRRWRVWQYTLSELLVLMFLVAGVLGWWRTNHLRVQKEDDFVISSFGDYPFTRCKEYRGPVFLGKLFGEKYLTDFFTVTFFPLPNNIDIYCPDVEFPFSSSLPNIESIDADKATHADIEEISKLRHLKSLCLDTTNVSDTDITAILRISSLESLTLSKTPITKKGILALQSLPRLKALDLCKSSIGDDSARALAYLENLQYLSLRETHISNASVSYLGNLTGLKILDIEDTDITDHGYRRLHRLLPQCKIIYRKGQETIENEPESEDDY
jgi:hypothetical protein